MGNKITLKDFFEISDKVGIYCSTKTKARILCQEFYKMGKRWATGESYSEYTFWDKDTVYLNNDTWENIDICKHCNYPIFDFDDIIFERNDTMDGELFKTIGGIIKRCADCKNNKPLIKSVTLNDKKKITTVVFTDGDVKMVKCGEDDIYSPEMGIVYCIALKYSNMSKTQFKKYIDGYITNRS